MKTRREIYEAHFRRYQEAGKSGKGKILDELAGTTGLNRDHGETLFRTLMCWQAAGRSGRVRMRGTAVFQKPAGPERSGSRGSGAGDRLRIRTRCSYGC
ncbi:MAG: hypothetical protein LBG45_02785 [Dysgonamonadaceae bacterium]|nr:hypothetical protein [Dysgonamonadaceae bacterium]